MADVTRERSIPNQLSWNLVQMVFGWFFKNAVHELWIFLFQYCTLCLSAITVILSLVTDIMLYYRNIKTFCNWNIFYLYRQPDVWQRVTFLWIINEEIVKFQYKCHRSIFCFNINHCTKFHLNLSLFDASLTTCHFWINNWRGNGHFSI